MLLKVALKGLGPIVTREMEWFPHSPCPVDIEAFRRQTLQGYEILRRKNLPSP